MIPLTFLYDEYIDRPILTEKKPFEYIVPPPTSGVGTISSFSNIHLQFEDNTPSLTAILSNLGAICFKQIAPNNF